MTASGTWSLGFTDDVTAEINYKMYRVMVPAQIWAYDGRTALHSKVG